MMVIDIIDKIIPILKKAYKSKEWERMFVDTADKIENFEQDEQYNKLEEIFSEKQIRQLAKDNKKGGYSIICNIEEELNKYFLGYDLLDEKRQQYINDFIRDLKEKIKAKFPEEYDKIFLGEFRTENIEQHSEIKYAIEDLSSEIIELKNQSLNIKTCNELNEWYKTNTKNSCSLELFNHDNKYFVSEFLDELREKGDSINVKGENVFEVVAYIAYLFLNDKRFIEFKEKVIIIEDEYTWNHIEKTKISNKILINRFKNNDSIDIVKNNLCIFIYGKNEYLKTKNCILLEKRYFRNLTDKISECGFKDAYKIAISSRNNYTILMRQLCKGKTKEPVWVNLKNYNLLLPMMVLNKWNDSDSVMFDLLLSDSTFPIEKPA